MTSLNSWRLASVDWPTIGAKSLEASAKMVAMSSGVIAGVGEDEDDWYPIAKDIQKKSRL